MKVKIRCSVPPPHFSNRRPRTFRSTRCFRIPGAFCLLALMILPLNGGKGQEPETLPEARVMWALSGVLPRDRAHWIRNFDLRQRIPGIYTFPNALVPEDPLSPFTPQDLRRMAELCDAAGCRFFFVVHVSPLQENLQSWKEGRRINYQQKFRQNVTLRAFRKVPGTLNWEKVEPVSGVAVDTDMVGMSDLPPEELKLRKNVQRCQFLRKGSAETAADLTGKALVDLQARTGKDHSGRIVYFSYTLTNLSPLELSTVYVWLPVSHQGKTENEKFIFGGDIRQVGILEPFGTASFRHAYPPGAGQKPKPGEAWVEIHGWSQEELDSRQSRRKGLRLRRSDWKEHENLPPAAHEIDWEAEEEERGTAGNGTDARP